jgi:hypothetical protein
VFGELAQADLSHKLLVLSGSVVMIFGAAMISSAAASGKEQSSRNQALLRECDRYGLDYWQTLTTMDGEDDNPNNRRRWWDYAIVVAAVSVFVYLGVQTHIPALKMNTGWIVALTGVLLVSLVVGGYSLWRRTRFS